mgnify:CR=1 FL=1
MGRHIPLAISKAVVIVFCSFGYFIQRSPLVVCMAATRQLLQPPWPDTSTHVASIVIEASRQNTV